MFIEFWEAAQLQGAEIHSEFTGYANMEPDQREPTKYDFQSRRDPQDKLTLEQIIDAASWVTAQTAEV